MAPSHPIVGYTLQLCYLFAGYPTNFVATPTNFVACIHHDLTVSLQQVILITNSDDGWVKYSCERYLPDLLPALDKYRIVSARTLYEKFYPGQPLCWKAAAFAHEVNEMYEACMPSASDSDNEASQLSLESTDVSSASSDESDMDEDDSASESSADCHKTATASHREIISFGDSMEEKMAVRIVAEQMGAMPKSVMFIQLPTPVQILGELQMVINHMGFVCHNKANLDLEISPEQAENHADMYLRKRRMGTSRHYGKSSR